MSLKLLSASIVLLVGITLGSLFRRNVADEARPSPDHGVMLRRSNSQAVTRLPGFGQRAEVPPAALAVEPDGSESNAPSEIRESSNRDLIASALRNPPAMSAEYAQAIAAVPFTPTVLPERTGARRQAPKSLVHEVVDGDTLALLAGRYLGNQDLADRIWEANRDQIQNPAILPIGLELKIPASGDKSEPVLADARRREGAETRLVPVQPAQVMADANPR